MDGNAIDAHDENEGFDVIMLGHFFAALTRKHDGMEFCFLDALADHRGDNSYKGRLRKIEEIIMASFQAQLISATVLLLAHLRVSHGSYHTLVNATSWATGDGGNRATLIFCPLAHR